MHFNIQGIQPLQVVFERTLHAARKAKTVDFFSATQALFRELNAGRITSCKSGKDRTAMAVLLW